MLAASHPFNIPVVLQVMQELKPMLSKAFPGKRDDKIPDDLL
jgi:hypothetical protein